MKLYDKINDIVLNIHKQGEPSYSVLYIWIRQIEESEVDREHVVRRVRSKRIRDDKFFLEQQWLLIVRLCLEGNCKIKDIASDYGVTPMITCKWIKNYLSKGYKVLDTK